MKRRIPVAIAAAGEGYAGLATPYPPGRSYSELGDASSPGQEPNAVFAAVRACLAGLDLDAQRIGTSAWNPLSDLVRTGGSVVLKPNFIRHWNPCPGESWESVITHGAVIRAVADYAWKAVGAAGSVTIAEAPQQDCDFDQIRSLVGLDELIAHYGAQGKTLGVIDLRREAVTFRDGIIVERRSLPGDPQGYREVDLGDCSFFAASGLEPHRFRGADYDPAPTAEYHRDGRNAYLLSESVLSADLVVNLPKMKTHKKTGVTLALKNLVGINGDKNWLPHHSAGSPSEGGDEYPDGDSLTRWRSWALDRVRPILARGWMGSFFRWVRRTENAVRGEDFIRAGNWYGNQTTWRMCCDLNRAFYYSDANGLHLDAAEPVRRVLSLLDAVVGGEGAGPLAPSAVPVGRIVASLDPVALDIVAIRLMGFEPQRIPKVNASMQDTGPRLTNVRSPDEILPRTVDPEDLSITDGQYAEIPVAHPFRPHAGWTSHLRPLARKAVGTAVGNPDR